MLRSDEVVGASHIFCSGGLLDDIALPHKVVASMHIFFCWVQDKFPYTISQKLFHKEFRNFELGRRENFKAYRDLSQNFLNVPAEICGLL